MRNIKYVALTLLVCVFLGGCIKSRYGVTFTFPAAINTTVRVVYYAADKKGGLLQENTVVVTAGKGELQGITRNPCLGLIYENRGQLPACIFFAERGDDVKISGQDVSPFGWTVEGNKTNSQLTEWRLKNQQLLKNAVMAQDMNDAAVFNPLNAAIEKYVTDNPESAASVALFTVYYNASVSPDGFNKLNKILTESGALDDYSSIVYRQDLFTAEKEAGKNLKLYDLAVRSIGTGADTLRLASSKKPSILYFWHREDASRTADMDSLRRIVKWRGDSARFTIADLSLEADSAVWAFSLRTDSIQHTVRGWIPRGEADPDLMTWGVSSTPWWIVTSPSGQILYSGPDSKTAISTLRKGL